MLVRRVNPGWVMENRDPLFLFCCYVASREEKDLAYKELVAALDDPSEEIRKLAHSLLQRRAAIRRV